MKERKKKMTLNKLNFKRATSAIFGLVIVLIFASLIVGSIYAYVAYNSTTFSQANGGRVTAVDPVAKTVTVSYPQLGAVCYPNFCPKGKAPDVLKQGEVLVTNDKDWVENDITKMKVGDSVTVYFQSSSYRPSSNNNIIQLSVKTIPYAVKDFSLLPPDIYPAGDLKGIK